ncbi:MAG: transketolase C-terminal domain-containing protein [Bacteroidota bacterium]|nr:transketolase C-terminal domain-containing protein [Bacteroidota bacterium]
MAIAEVLDKTLSIKDVAVNGGTNGAAGGILRFEAHSKKATRFGFGEGLVVLGERYENVVVIGGDITGSVMTSYFRDKFPDRFFSMGITEATATLVSAGLALSGMIPFFATYGAFASCRNTDMLRISLAYNDANVKIGGGHAGISVGEDGATHQALEEIAIVRVIPNMTLVVPCDYLETKKATIAIGEHCGPCYIRFGRSDVPSFTHEDTPFELGKAQTFREGKDVTVIACGPLVWESLVAAYELETEGIDVRVINMATIKPIDRSAILKAARETGAIVTAEEHQITAGLGGAVSEVLAQECPTPVEFIGVKDTFGGSGKPDELMKYFGLTSSDVKTAIHNVLARKK